MNRITKKQFVEKLLIPWYSILHGFDILRSGILDICKSVQRSFQRGPKDELATYWKDIVKYADQRFGIRLGISKSKRRSSQIASNQSHSPKGELATYWEEIVQYLDQRFGIRFGKSNSKTKRRRTQVVSGEEFAEKVESESL